MQTQHDSRGNRFGLVLLLAILLFAIVGFALYSNQGDDGGTAMKVKKAKNAASGEDVAENIPTSQQGTVKRTESGLSSVSGTIVELLEMSGTGGKRIKLSVSDVDAIIATAPGATGEGVKETAPSFKTFLFFLSEKDTKGIKDIKGGDYVTVTFQGEPSEKDYLVASEVGKGE